MVVFQQTTFDYQMARELEGKIESLGALPSNRALVCRVETPRCHQIRNICNSPSIPTVAGISQHVCEVEVLERLKEAMPLSKPSKEVPENRTNCRLSMLPNQHLPASTSIYQHLPASTSWKLGVGWHVVLHLDP